MNFKLRIYIKSGVNKGNLDHEEFFKTREQMKDRYNELFVYKDYGLNPTAWYKVLDDTDLWNRLEGF